MLGLHVCSGLMRWDSSALPVKNYWRGIADFFGVILLKRRRIAGEVSTLWSWQGRGMGGDGRFWTIYTYVYISICIRTFGNTLSHYQPLYKQWRRTCPAARVWNQLWLSGCLPHSSYSKIYCIVTSIGNGRHKIEHVGWDCSQLLAFHWLSMKHPYVNWWNAVIKLYRYLVFYIKIR